jgi:hypothetical protein
MSENPCYASLRNSTKDEEGKQEGRRKTVNSFPGFLVSSLD